MLRTERGAAPLDAVFGTVFLIAMVLGVVQVAFTLYGRNVVAASAHEAARAVVERGRPASAANAVARSTVERAAGGLIQSLDVRTAVVRGLPRAVIRVTVTGRLRAFGPIPWPVRVSSTATAGLPETDP